MIVKFAEKRKKIVKFKLLIILGFLCSCSSLDKGPRKCIEVKKIQSDVCFGQISGNWDWETRRHRVRID